MSSDDTTADFGPPYDSDAVRRARVALDAPPERIGRYRILERLGTGGMGDVFVAEQTEPIRRRVAVKVIKAGMDTRQVVARFEAERQALAMMDHPNIAKVFDAGTTDAGRPYFVMELVRGVPITDFCDANKLTTRQRVELMVPVCQAVQHAHQKGIIHRDIKPHNVLVTLHDGKPVPKVIDFGIAKATGPALTDKTVYTEFRQLIGTPAYMSPEQAEMSGLDIDTRSDIYSLGVLTYELLTGRPPFDTARLVKAGLNEIQRIIREEEPPPPSLRLSTLGDALTTVASHRSTEPARLSKLVAGELDWIVMRAMEKDRQRRYDTASDLAADFTRHLAGEPVVAVPPSVLYRARKFLHTYRGPVMATAVVMAVLLAGVAATAAMAIEASRQAATARLATGTAKSNAAEAASAAAAANIARRRADANAREAALRLGQSLIAQADTLDQAHQIDDGRDRMQAAYDQFVTNGLPPFEAELGLWNQDCSHPPPLALSTATSYHTHLCAFTPDGRDVLFNSDAGVSGLVDVRSGRPLGVGTVPAHHLGLWNIVTGSVRAFADVAPDVTSLAVSPDGTTAVSGDSSGTIAVWNIRSGCRQRMFGPVGGRVGCVAFISDGNGIFTGHADGTLRLWSASGGDPIRAFVGPADAAERVAVTRDGSIAVTGGADGVVRVWDGSHGGEVRRLRGFPKSVLCVAISPDESKVVAADIDGGIQCWDRATGHQSWALPDHGQSVLDMQFRPDGQTIVSVNAANVPTVRATATGETVEMFPTVELGADATSSSSVPSRPSTSTAESIAETTAIGRDQVARTRPASQGAETGPTGPHMGAEEDGVVGTRSTTTVFPSETFTIGEGGAEAARISPDGSSVLSCGSNRLPAVWDLCRPRERRRLLDAGNPGGDGAALGFNGSAVVVGDDDKLKLCDIETGRVLQIFAGHTSDVTCVALNRETSTVVSGGRDQTIRWWDVQTGRQLSSQPNDGGTAEYVAFSPDGNTLLSTSRDGALVTYAQWDRSGNARLWKSAKPSETYGLTQSVSPDGVHALVCNSSDTDPPHLSPLVVDMRTGQTGRRYPGSLYGVFSPDGQHVLTANTASWNWCDTETARVSNTSFINQHSFCAVFAPDSTIAVATGLELVGRQDGITHTLVFWEPASGRVFRTVYSDRGEGVALFSPDQKRILTAGSDGFYVWDIDRARRNRAACSSLPKVEAALHSNPTDSDALDAIGEWWAFRGRDAWAVELLEKSRANGGHVSALTLARCYWNLDRNADARREFRRAIDDHEAPEPYLRLCLNAVGKTWPAAAARPVTRP